MFNRPNIIMVFLIFLLLIKEEHFSKVTGKELNLDFLDEIKLKAKHLFKAVSSKTLLPTMSIQNLR